MLTFMKVRAGYHMRYNNIRTQSKKEAMVMYTVVAIMLSDTEKEW